VQILYGPLHDRSLPDWARRQHSLMYHMYYETAASTTASCDAYLSLRFRREAAYHPMVQRGLCRLMPETAHVVFSQGDEQSSGGLGIKDEVEEKSADLSLYKGGVEISVLIEPAREKPFGR
jgi:hypothetical protein